MNCYDQVLKSLSGKKNLDLIWVYVSLQPITNQMLMNVLLDSTNVITAAKLYVQTQWDHTDATVQLDLLEMVPRLIVKVKLSMCNIFTEQVL